MFLDRARGLAALVAVAQCALFGMVLRGDAAGMGGAPDFANRESAWWWSWFFGIAAAGVWRCLRAPGGHAPRLVEAFARSAPALVLAGGGWVDRFLWGGFAPGWRDAWFALALAVLLAGTHWGLPRIFGRLVFPKPHRHRAVLVGRAGEVAPLCKLMREQRTLGIEPVAWLAQPEEGSGRLDLPRLWEASEFGRRIAELECTHVVLTAPLPGTLLGERIAECEKWGLRLVLAHSLEGVFPGRFGWESHGGWCFSSVRSEPLQNPFNRALKRGLDLAVALPALVLGVLPVGCITWWMQRRQSPGPLFYRQWRHGQGNREFRVWKFRTMHLKPELEGMQAGRNDARVYPFGAWLRRHSLDELPQFLNVLAGEMSVVGPRPHFTEHTRIFSEQESYYVRHFVKPGVTGLAQVNGCRGEVLQPEDLQRRIAWDIHYVENWNLWLDCRLILQTAGVVFRPPESAY